MPSKKTSTPVKGAGKPTKESKPSAKSPPAKPKAAVKPAAVKVPLAPMKKGKSPPPPVKGPTKGAAAAESKSPKAAGVTKPAVVGKGPVKVAAPSPSVKGSTKPTPGKPAPATSVPGKAGGKSGKVETKPSSPLSRYSVMSSDQMATSRAAAARLAAAAGLHPVKSTGNGDAPARNYTRLTKSPFDKKELAEFREVLLAKRRQIEGDVNAMETEALSGGGGSLSHLPQHMADQGTDTFDQSLALDLAASQRTLLKEIDDALSRIEAGTYGICEDMGKPVSVERLRHTPWARYCIEAARQHERAAYLR